MSSQATKEHRIDPSGPLTPDIPLNNSTINPFFSTVRQYGGYEFTETKLDDFKCARHLTTGESYLYKEYPTEQIRQRLEPYRRLTSLLLSSSNNQRELQSKSLCQLAAKYHFHFYSDLITFENTTYVIFPTYTNHLHTFITDRHRLSEGEARQLFSQMVRAVQLCHRVGLILRDMKLRKLIFQATRSHVLLTGLDDAIVLSSYDDDYISSRFSCPVYACPEIVVNRQNYSGKRADAWCLGIILYTMLFGRYPFCDRTLVGLFTKISRCRPDIPRTISIKARSLLRSLIRAKPQERMTVDEILGHVWFNHESTTVINPIQSNHHSRQDDGEKKTIIEDDAVVPNLPCE